MSLNFFFSFFFAAAEQPPLLVELASTRRKKREEESPKENGEQRSNGVEVDANSDRSGDRQPDVVDDHPGKSRSTFNSCHTSVILYAYRLFKIRYFIQS